MLSEVYLDEAGTHEGARVLCMAGYLFTKENAAKFSAEIQPVYDRLKIPFFHASEILGGRHKPDGKGPFTLPKRRQNITSPHSVLSTKRSRPS